MLTSRYATIGGIPIAALGAGYYAVASLMAWTPAEAWRKAIARAFAALTGSAFAVSAVLFYLQAAVIHAWCRFCLVSASITALLFLTALVLLHAASRDRPADLEPGI